MSTADKCQSDLRLLDVVDGSNAEDIPFAIVGGFGAAVQGVDQGTKEVDVMLQITLPERPPRASRLKEERFTATPRLSGSWGLRPFGYGAGES